MLTTNEYLSALDLRPQYEKTDPENSLQLRALSYIISERLRDIGAFDTPWPNIRKRQLVFEFSQLWKKKDLNKDEFNRVMVWLYQWADTPVGTFGVQKACQILILNSFEIPVEGEDGSAYLG